MEGKKDYKCDVCNKFYKNYKSLWKHKYIFHKVDVVGNVNESQKQVNDLSMIQNDKADKYYECRKCNKIFNQRQGRWAHEKICKENNKEIQIEEIKKENLEIKNKVIQLEKIIKKSGNKLNTKINTQNNNTNNGSIVNININALGNEEFMKKLSDKEKFNLLTSPLFEELPIVELVNKIYTDDKLKEDRNTKITNLQSSFGYKFDEKNNKFIAVNKNELLNDILDSRMYDIENFYEDMQYKMDPIKADQIKLFIDRMTVQEDGLKNLKKEEIKLILYNNREKIISNKDSETLNTLVV